jgi:hypothetical protein
MIRGSLASKDYRPQLSGHETFPLRYGWLKKAYDAAVTAQQEGDTKSVFSSDDAIARFGVGKNMVTSMRHWAIAGGILDDKTLEPTRFGHMIFDQEGLDPYMEHPATLWLIHWFLAGRPARTTFYWAFGHYQDSTFERRNLVNGLTELAQEQQWHRAASSTIKRDVECFVRVYAAKQASGKSNHEDALESPLTELGIIRPIGLQDGFRFVRGPKPTLGQGVFLYALHQFCQERQMTSSSLRFEAIAHDPGSPGRVFRLDEDALFGRLQEIHDISKGKFAWSESTGLKQVIRHAELTEEDAFDAIRSDYRFRESREVA